LTKEVLDCFLILAARPSQYNALELRMTPWEAVERMSAFVDVSDPDVELPQISHCIQTAESIREAGLPEWFQLVGFIHDLGKVIYLRGCDEDGTSAAEQFSIVGDTFVLGEPLPDCLVFSDMNCLNPDAYLRGTYPSGVGLSSCNISFGHDEYLYQVLSQAQQEGMRIPEEGLYAIRFHSLYAWHTGGAYSHLEDQKDRSMKPWVLLLNKHDLYSKASPYSDKKLDELKGYYRGLMETYLPEVLLW